GTLARFVPVTSSAIDRAPVLFRRHPWSAAMGMVALFSLAGVPGTPGARLWLAVARDLVAGNRTWLLVALAAAWLAAFASAMRQLREAVGRHDPLPPPARPVPWQARAALWLAGSALVALEVLS